MAALMRPPQSQSGDSIVARLLIAVKLLIAGTLLAAVAGCGGKPASSVDPEPFKKAVATYLERGNMAMALKEIKSGPEITGATATMTASLTHAQMGGPSVTWTFTFEKNPDGTWKAAKHAAP
jgi:hypothetical protein